MTNLQENNGTTNDINTLLSFQKYFNTDLLELINTQEDEIKYIKQTHYGDLIIEESNINNERFNLYRALDENISQGEPLICIEYSGKQNNYTYKTVLNFNL